MKNNHSEKYEINEKVENLITREQLVFSNFINMLTKSQYREFLKYMRIHEQVEKLHMKNLAIMLLKGPQNKNNPKELDDMYDKLLTLLK